MALPRTAGGVRACMAPRLNPHRSPKVYISQKSRPQGVTALSLLVSRLSLSDPKLASLPEHLPRLARAAKLSLKVAAEQLAALRGAAPSRPATHKDRFLCRPFTTSAMLLHLS